MSNDNTACIDVTISGCTFSNVIRALGNHTSRGAGYYETDVVIKNNTFSNVSGHVMIIDRFKNITISGNKFSNISSNSIGGCMAYVYNSVNKNGTAYKNASPVTTWRNNNTYLKNGKCVKLSTLTNNRQFIIK